MQAILALESGRIFRGEGYSTRRTGAGDPAFNASLTGSAITNNTRDRKQ